MDEQITISTKPRSIVIIEGALYFIISALTPVGAALESNQVMDGRRIAAITITALVAGSVALKAFFSQSQGRS